MRVGKGKLIQKIINKLEEEYSLTPKTASIIIDAVFSSVTDLLKDEGRVNVPNFGTFVITTSKPRTARNPRTGEAVEVPAKKRVKFRPSGKLSKQFN